MDPFNRKSAEISGKSLRERSRRQSEDSEGHDSYELAVATVSDGFRPTDLTPTDTSSSSSTPNNPEVASPDSSQARLLSLNPSNQQQSSSATSKPPPSAPARPSSAYKPPRPHDSLTLHNDGSNSAQTGPSLASSAGMPQLRPQSPYRGPTSASHPYQMYLQRTLSNATASTDQPANRRSYDGHRGPAHPYALYPQNIATTGDETPHQIPLGFAAAGDGYQRQIGPDGEEAGALVGPLGHTEELPPYTRYPDQAFASKTPAVAIPEETMTGTGTSTPAGTVAGAGRAARNPEFSSTEEDLQPSQSRPSTHSRHDINTAAQSSAEKATMNKWQRRGKKKLWGIVPYWAICLLLIGVVLMGVILGAVIGTVLSHHKSRPSGGPSDDTYPTPTPAPDVIPLRSVPIGLPRLPPGNYALPPVFPSAAPNTCLADHSQLSAWSCNLPYSYYQMNVDVSADAEDTSCYNLTLKAINPLDSQFLWGTQPPHIYGAAMQLVNDTMEPRRGPAWWLQVTYDKTVVVQEEEFSIKAKRWDNLGRPLVNHDVMQSRGASVGAKNGDKPWICTWPDTKLEVFIYPTQNASSSPHPTSTVAPVSNPYPTDGFHPYPKTVKFTENRVAALTPKPFCRQVVIYNDGRSMKNLTDSFGKPIVIELDETFGGDDDQQKGYRRKRDERPVRRSWSDPWIAKQVYNLTPCGCLLWSSPITNPS
ncbi:uncharacterized protein Triagg1_3606 [Trichoderma aggressivum f. europaeum]|uniref:DUF7820 domain-containing protein n=1 Tax=Trichoderma aggressivum f. europaeum TaxID=173218 RepID=A0AAE1M0G2_9HYPO|nr:hypothetical protein Triagg1_3606 [Trichoderma aggressivum f. europaeum]